MPKIALVTVTNEGFTATMTGKTISGKIRRVELRAQENERAGNGTATARDPDGIGAPFRPEPSPRDHRVLGGGLQLVTSAVVNRAHANEPKITR